MQRSWIRCFATFCVALASGLSLSACPEGAAQKLSATCHKAYDKCLVAEGVLGICDNVECAEGKTPPCLACRPQH